jgi:hypothetical protein
MPRFNCPQCGVGIDAPRGSAGKRGTCHRCAARIVVPESAESVESVAETAGDSGNASSTRLDAGDNSGEASGPPPPLFRDRTDDAKPPDYGELKIAAGVFVVLGVIVAASGILSSIIAMNGTGGMSRVSWAVIAAGNLATAAILFSIGAIIDAFRDLVRNSWRR